MKTKLLLMAMVLTTVFSSCKRLLNDWPGTYNGNLVLTNTFTQVVISEVDDNTLKMVIKKDSAGALVTKATLVDVSFFNQSEAQINETGSVSDLLGTWTFTGTAHRDNDRLTMDGTASQVGTASTFTFTFDGNR